VDAVPDGQAEGSVMQPRGGKQGYFPGVVVPAYVFLQIYKCTVWRFAQQTLEPVLFLLKQYPEGAHMLYLPSHRVHNHKIAVYCGEAQQQKYRKKRLGERGRKKNCAYRYYSLENCS